LNCVEKRLDGGDFRSIGGADGVLEDLYKDTSLFDKIFDCLYIDKPIDKMRSADVIEKFTLRHPEYLQPYKDKLLHEIAGIDQKEVRWHLCQIIPRLKLSENDIGHAFILYKKYLHDKTV